MEGSPQLTLEQALGHWAGHDDVQRADIAATLLCLTRAAVALADVIREGAAGSADERDTANAAGDKQHNLDVHADDLYLAAARTAPVAIYASEELDAPVVLDRSKTVAIAIDPLDGSSNIDVNVSIGTIFSILPVLDGGIDDPDRVYQQVGRAQRAAGFIIFGPQTALALTLGDGVQIYLWSARRAAFVCQAAAVAINPKTREFAINASNYRHWDEAVRLYFDDCIKGGHGPREDEFNMRWLASLVAETFRILVRGGVFLYPGDRRRGYARGRLRLVYEAHPIAMLVEQAGGKATDTVTPILDLAASSLHERVPFVFGSEREVTRIARYHTMPSTMADRAPLFGTRGLFRA